MKDFIKYVFATITGYIIIMVLFTFLGVVMIISAAMSSEKALPVKAQSVVKLNLSGEIVDRKIDDPFSELPIFGEDRPPITGLNEIINLLEKAANDPNVDGIYVQHGALQAGMATCTEIRDALKRFKESGKFVYSYAAYYAQNSYYIATVSDSIFLNPAGGVDLRGFVSQQIFFKHMLEKLDVEMNVIKHGTHKSAVEPFTNDKNSPENVEQVKAILDGFWNDFAQTIESSRGISRADLDRYANSAMLFQDVQLNLEYKLVDALVYYNELEDVIRTKQGKEAGKKIHFVELNKYKKAQGAKEKKKEAEDEIALVYANGAIDSGRDGIKSGKLSETLREIYADKDIKALVLRVNSPGGGGYGSEQIWHEVKRLREKMPVVVSMGDVAASGGYYISCAADTILVSPNTITGSIGAFMVFPKFGKTFEKFGITTDQVKTHEMADIVNGMNTMRPAEKELMQKWMDKFYVEFANDCAEGRGTSFEAIDAVGQGRVWTGTQAIGNGLADAYGGLYEAVELAGEMAKLDDFKTNVFPKEKNFMEQLMEDLTTEVSTRFTKMRWGSDYELYQKARQMEELKGIQARMPFDLEVY